MIMKLLLLTVLFGFNLSTDPLVVTLPVTGSMKKMGAPEYPGR